MHIQELRKLLNAKLEYNKTALKGRRVTNERKARLSKEVITINVMVEELNQGVLFTYDGEYVTTNRSRVKVS